MIYLFCKRPSDSAREMTLALNAVRLRNFDGMNFWRKNKRVKLVEGDFVICWGDEFPVENDLGVHVLNGAEVGNKYDAARTLYSAAIPTISVLPKDDPPFSQGAWLRRKFYHVGGNDLLNPSGSFDYYAKKEKITKEFRVHSFRSKSIRAGEKALRDAFTLTNEEGKLPASPWIRTYDGGWYIKYDGYQSNKAIRTLAHKAVETLKLDFGAVDIGLTEGGDLKVLEVNRAPGMEGNSITAYVNAVRKWIDDVTGNAGNVEVQEQPARPATQRVVTVTVQAPPVPVAPQAAEPTRQERVANGTEFWDNIDNRRIEQLAAAARERAARIVADQQANAAGEAPIPAGGADPISERLRAEAARMRRELHLRELQRRAVRPAVAGGRARRPRFE